MGFIHFEKFDKLSDWTVSETVPDQFELFEDPTPELLHPFSGKAIVGIKLKDRNLNTPQYIEKSYPGTVKPKVIDSHGVWITYPILRLVYKANLNKQFSFLYKNVEEFFVTVELVREDKILGQWYLPIFQTGCRFTYLDIDLSRIFVPGQEFVFDTVRIRFIDNPGNSLIYFGSLYILEEEPSHNLSVALADLLHNKYRKELWALAKDVEPGSKLITLNSSVDLFDNIAIAIGDPDGTYELHVVDKIVRKGNREVEVSFTNEFDTYKTAMGWPAGTKVWYVVPSLWYDLSESEAIFPLIFIYSESPTPAEEMGRTSKLFDSYRILSDGSCEVAVTKGLEAVNISANIQVFAPTREFSEPVYKMLRSIIDNQGNLWVAGEEVDYAISEWGTDPSSEEPFVAKNSMSLNLMLKERVYKRSYQKFPLFKDIVVDFGIQVSQDVNKTAS
jgi:hypothetical protein